MSAAICELCGRTFATEQEKEQHKQMEHRELYDDYIGE
jgi:hypothetical protein